MKEYEWNGGVAPLVPVLEATLRPSGLLYSPAALISWKKVPITKLMGRVCRGGGEGASNKRLGNKTENNQNYI